MAVTADTEMHVGLQSRIRDLEGRLACSATQHNDQVCKLESEVARLQSSLEQNEAVRQQLQYQLELGQNTYRQKEAGWLAERQRQESEASGKEREMKSLQHNLQRRVAKLTRQCQEWSCLLEKVKQARAQDAAQSERTMATKDGEIAELRTKIIELEKVRNEIADKLETERSLVSNLKNSLQQLEEHYIMSGSCPGELVAKRGRDREKVREEVKEVVDKMLELQQQIQVVREEKSEVEERLEAEKAAHLDTKFTCKVIQLQVEEMQSAMEGEQRAQDQTTRELAQTKSNLQEVKLSLDASCKREQTLQRALESRDLRCRSLGQKLKERDGVISDLNQQIQTSSSTCRSLQEGLAQVKQQRTKSDEMVRKWARDMEDLLRGHPPHKPPTHTARAVDTPQPVLVRALLTQLAEHMRAILIHYTTDLHSANTQLVESRDKLQQVERVCEKLRQSAASKESIMRETKKHISESTERASSLTLQLEQCKSALKTAREGEETAKTELETEKCDSQQTRLQLQEMVANHKTKLKSHCTDLNNVATSLLALLVTHSYESQPLLSSNNWNKLLSSTKSSILALTEHMKITSANKRQLQVEVDSLRSTLAIAQNTHRETVAKLEQACEEKEAQWRDKTTELTTHYSTLLREAEQRSKQLQQFADEALSKAEEASSARLQLQAQLAQSTETANACKHDRACLLPCVCLLSATLFPLLSRLQQLTVQKTLLTSQLTKYHSLERMVTGILHSLPQSEHRVEDMKATTDPSRGVVSPSRMRFRKIVIVVLAVLLLKRLWKESSLLFQSPVLVNGMSHYLLPVCISLKHNKDKPSRYRATFRDRKAFLHSKKLLKTVREGMKELAMEETAITSGKSDVGHSTISPGVIRGRYTCLIKGLGAYFEPLSRCTLDLQSTTHSTTHRQSIGTLCYSSDCLARRLAGGLSQGHPSSPLESGRALHGKVMALLHRLREGQETQQSLHSQLEKTHLECQRLMQRQQQQVVELQWQLDHLHHEVASKGSQYEVVQHDLKDKTTALAAALKELSEVRLEVKQRDIQLERGERQWQTADSERQTLELQLHDLQATLQSTVTEKEASEELMKVTGSVFKRSQQQLSKTHDSSHTVRLVQKVVEEFVKHKPDFSKYLGPTKETLQSFVEAHHSVLVTVSSLQSQLACATDYIQALRSELSAVCRRETAAAAFDGAGQKGVDSGGGDGGDGGSGGQGYITLREHTLTTSSEQTTL